MRGGNAGRRSGPRSEAMRGREAGRRSQAGRRSRRGGEAGRAAHPGGPTPQPRQCWPSTMPKPRRRSGPLCRAPHLEAVSHCPTTRRSKPLPGRPACVGWRNVRYVGPVDDHRMLQSFDHLVWVSPRRPGMRWYAKMSGIPGQSTTNACVGASTTGWLQQPVHHGRSGPRRQISEQWASAPRLGAMSLCSLSRSRGLLLRRLEQRAVASPVEARHRDLHWVPGLKGSGPGQSRTAIRVVPHRHPG